MSNENNIDNLFSDNLLPENSLNSLTDEQKLLILKIWEEHTNEPPSIEFLLEKAFPNSKTKLDGRTKEGRLVKAFLAENALKPKTKTEYQKKGLLELTYEQKQYIENNLNMGNKEIAQILFNKPFLAPSSQEVRTIAGYKDELKANGIIKIPEKPEINEKYNPPNRIDHCCARINQNVEGVNYDFKTLNPTQKKHVNSLINYLHNRRFTHFMNLISIPEDRQLFENTFIKYIYNKPDLTQEDLDQYLALAHEAVTESSIKRQIMILENEQQRSLDEENKIAMNIIEAIKTTREEYNACRGRQDKLYKALEVERSKRLNERVGSKFTLLNIVECMKNEETRKALIEEAEKRNEKIKGEIKRLSKMDEIICRIYGLDEDTIING